MVPLKVNVFIWLMLLNALPTHLNLQQRGINLGTVNCVLCGLEVEDLDHCLFNCSKIDHLWRKVWSWCSISSLGMDSVQSFKNNLYTRDRDHVKSEMTHAILMVTLWLIWRWRNRILHSTQEEVVKIFQEDLFLVVQRMSPLWITNRKAKWMQWSSNSLDIGF